MSIQSEINRITDEISTQANLIEDIKENLEEKNGIESSSIDNEGTPLEINTIELENVLSLARSLPDKEKELCEGIVTRVSNRFISYLRSSAFTECSSLELVNLPLCSVVPNNAFNKCISLSEIYLDSLPSVSSTTNPFNALASLEVLHLNGASTIVASAFASCTKLREISFDSISQLNAGTNKATLEKAHLENCLTLNTNAFNGCKVMQELHAPNVNKVNGNALANCGLQNLTLPSLTTIGSTTFTSYMSCVNVSFDTLPSLSFDGLFSGRKSLETFYAPLIDGVRANTFNGCDNLKYADFPNASLVYKNAFLNCKMLSYANTPLATKVSDGGFQGCNSLESISMPLVTQLAANAFYQCFSMPEFSFRDVTVIGANAFRSCSQVSKVYLHLSESLSTLTIGATAFVDCVNLYDLYIDSKFVPKWTWSSGMFANSPLSPSISGGTIHVRESLVESFINTAPWKSIYSGGIIPFVAIEDEE